MPEEKRPALLIAGGGTGGHIQPALAIADAFHAAHPDIPIHFCGTARGLENDLVPAAGYPFHAVRARGFPRKPSLELFHAMADHIAGRRACEKLIQEYRPFAVVGTGGYVCGPLVAAARRLRIPVLLHEQNAFPGRANRFLSRHAHTVCISYEGTGRYFPRAGNVVLTGNPVREVFFSTRREEARGILGLGDGERLVLALGGSLGAASINSAILGWCSGGLPSGVRVVLAAGRRNADETRRLGAGITGLDVRDYLQDAHIYMAAAEVIVCRAGAITCAEIAALGRPSVLVPYPFAAGDHQTFNARAFEQCGAAVLVPDKEFLSLNARDILESLLDNPARLMEMGQAARALARPDAAARIESELETIYKEAGHG